MAQESTYFDLLVEYYEDLFEESPEFYRDAIRDEDGEIYFEETGDPLIDKWEKELRMGIDPDLEEGLGQETKKQLKKEKTKKDRAQDKVKELERLESSLRGSLLGGS